MLGAPELVVLLALSALPGLFALIEILRSQFRANDKLIWCLLVVVMPLLGALLYLFIGRRQRIGPADE